jgi:hypothetical protein
MAHKHVRTPPCWNLVLMDSTNTTLVARIWRVTALRRNPEVAARDHLSLACTSGLVREVNDRSHPPYSPSD